jgi:hypothetical protein
MVLAKSTLVNAYRDDAMYCGSYCQALVCNVCSNDPVFQVTSRTVAIAFLLPTVFLSFNSGILTT